MGQPDLDSPIIESLFSSVSRLCQVDNANYHPSMKKAYCGSHNRGLVNNPHCSLNLPTAYFYTESSVSSWTHHSAIFLLLICTIMAELNSYKKVSPLEAMDPATEFFSLSVGVTASNDSSRGAASCQAPTLWQTIHTSKPTKNQTQTPNSVCLCEEARGDSRCLHQLPSINFLLYFWQFHRHAS